MLYNAQKSMGIIELNTRQYTELMRSVTMAMVVNEHLANLRGEKPDAEIMDLWEDLLDHAEEFGMSFPPEDIKAAHWTNDLIAEADDTVHDLLDVAYAHA